MIRLSLFFLLGCLLVMPVPAHASEDRPLTLEELQDVQLRDSDEQDADVALLQQNNLRVDAMHEAAMSYGARGGLAMQTFRIRQALEQKSAYLDRIYDFNQLLIPTHSGLLIEPPIISESLDALMIESGGQSAAVADRILEINRNARIVPIARNWRSYLEREWGELSEPPMVLRPESRDERREWANMIAEGWREGEEQANAIFQSDLARLNQDFTGMVRYRMLLAQGQVSPPFALHMDRGVTGDGQELVIGDRAVQITGPSLLQTGPNTWKPANR